MDIIKIYGIKNCNKIRETRSWFDDQGVDYEFVDLKKSPLPAEILADFTEKVGLDVLLNRKGMTWRRLGLSKTDPTDQELFDLLLENQTMIKRPLISRGEAILVGYDEDAFLQFIQ